MARSQTNLDIDLLTIADLYTRGYYLSTNTTYMPVLSTIGLFSKWVNTPILDVFQSLFYDYEKYSSADNDLSRLLEQVENISTSMQLHKNDIIQFSNANYPILVSLSNIFPSTILGYTDLAKLNSTIGSQRYIYISTTMFTVGPIIMNDVKTFYNNYFAPVASTIIENAIYNYIPRENINEFTYDSITNTNPRFNGIFGSVPGAPLPWYWQDSPSLYIGPGISSISSIFQDTSYPFYTNISTNFSNTLYNISTAVYNSNSTLNTYESLANSTADNIFNNYDNLSSILLSYSNVSSSINSSIMTMPGLYTNINNRFSTLSSIILNANISSFNISQISDNISSSFIALTFMTDNLNNMLINQISSGVLLVHLNNFSTIVNNDLSFQLTKFNQFNYFPGYFQLSTIYNRDIVSVYSTFNISTLQLNFFNLSSFNANIFSTFSSSLPYIVYSNVFSRELSNVSAITTNILNVAECTAKHFTIGPVLSSNFNTVIQGSALILPNKVASNASVAMPNFNIYTTTSTVTNDVSLYSYFSTFVINSGLSIVKAYNELYGYIGINTLAPIYAIDIAIGDARKPSGTDWITPSDFRVKENISEPLQNEIEDIMSLLRLAKFNWSPQYCEKFKVTSESVIGFISQEVEKILPDSVKDSEENGYADFKSLNIDQVFKIKYGITRNLLERVSTLTLRINGLMKES